MLYSVLDVLSPLNSFEIAESHDVFGCNLNSELDYFGESTIETAVLTWR